MLSGTPASGTGGQYQVSVTASNDYGTSLADVVTVTVDQAPSMTSASTATFSAGVSSNFSVTVAAGTYPAPTVTDSAFSGCSPSTLPTGVTLSSSGQLTSTSAATQAGAYTICLQVSNGVGAVATQTFTLTIVWDLTSFGTTAQQNQSGDFFGVAYDGSNIIAVGDDYATGNGEISYETGVTGANWSVVVDFNGTSDPSNSYLVTGPLYAVACPSTSVCVAGGRNASGTAAQILYTTASPTGAASWLNAALPSGVRTIYGISCPSVSVCFAVGDSTSGAAAILQSGNGGVSWTSMTVPSNLGTVTGVYGISCASTTDCNAVGQQYQAGSRAGAFLYYNGTAWTTQALTATGGELTGVACPSSTECLASGYAASGQAGVYYSANANSSPATWTLSDGIASPSTYLYAVGCLSTTVCYAGGWQSSGALLVESSNVTSSSPTWATVPVGPTGAIAWFSIFCGSASGTTGCTAVGSNNASPSYYPVAAFGS